jgi:beta-lactamase superfamily II metal-dependent hydrolase
MSLVKSFSVGNGDMFYIRHGSDNFTIIDCGINEENKDDIIGELKEKSRDKRIIRFISTHPDQDHIDGLAILDNEMKILNFYCVNNEASKEEETDDFERYVKLRDDEKKAFHVFKGCSRRWMNLSNDERKSACIEMLWPVTANDDYQQALEEAKDGESPNNISCIFIYRPFQGGKFQWMGDIETEMMEAISDDIDLEKVAVLFAPHHGRESGKVPSDWLEKLSPEVIIIGEAPSEHLNYYSGYNTITQNSAGGITFEAVDSTIHIYIENDSYDVDFLTDLGMDDTYGKYIGSIEC